MSTVQGLRAGLLAGILIGVTLSAGPISAQISALGAAAGTAEGTFTTERPSSVLIFPKVVNSVTTSDTIIQIANTSNGVNYVKCFYTDGRSIGGQPIWQITDFELVLTRQQPTHWAASRGRAVFPWPLDTDVHTSGLDPGLIPPVPPGFTGSLVCVETAVDGHPISGNSLKGEATIGEITQLGGNNHVSKYNAIGIPACVSRNGPCGSTGDANDSDNVLRLDGVEYAKCPGGQYLNFYAEGASDPAIDSNLNTPSVVSTNLTAVPCGFDFENLVPLTTRIIASPVRNELEDAQSSNPFRVTCWFSAVLDQPGVFGPPFVFAVGNLGTTVGKAVLRPVGPGLAPILGVANVLHTAGDLSSDTAALNLPFCTEESAPSLCVPFVSEIRLPTIP